MFTVMDKRGDFAKRNSPSSEADRHELLADLTKGLFAGAVNSGN